MLCTGNANAIDALRKLKRARLAHLPTPLEPLDRLSALLGGPRVWVKRDDCTGLATGGNKNLEDTTPLLDSIVSELMQQGRRPYVIPLGGSNGLGAAAYVEAFLELLDQFDSLQETLDAIVVPTVSGGTMAGLLLGAALSGWRGRIIGISAGDKTERAIQRVRTPQLAAAEILGAPSEIIGQMPTVIDDRFVGQGYGIPTLECVRAIELLARKEGLLLDPVYTGKAMAGLVTLVCENYFKADVRNLLFWHTGSSVALHAYPEIAGQLENAT